MGLLFTQPNQVHRSLMSHHHLIRNVLQQQEHTKTSTFHHSVAEITCGIICGCLPAFPAFIRPVSGIKVQLFKSASHRNHSRLIAWRTNTSQPIPETMKSPEGSPIISPSSTDTRKSPIYYGAKAMSPAMTGSRYHPWKELDELEYVAGDEERHVKERVKIPEPQRKSI